MGGIRTHNTTCSQVEVALLSLPHPRESGFCILRILNIFSACEVWFTFIFRKQEHLAVGSSVTRSYSLSWASTFRGRLALSFCTLIVSYFKGFVKRFFELFSFGREILFYFTQLRIGERLFAPVCLFTFLLYHTLGGLSRGFSNFLKNLFGWLYRTPTNALGCVAYYPRLLTMIVYHTPPQKSTWQSAQIRASKLFDFCTTFLLTNCWRYGIMEISATTPSGGRLKKSNEKAEGVTLGYS